MLQRSVARLSSQDEHSRLSSVSDPRRTIVPMTASSDSPLTGCVSISCLDTQVGRLSVAVSERGLVEVAWSEPGELAERAGRVVIADESLVRPVIVQLQEYFSGTRRRFDVALDWQGRSGAARTVLQTLHDTVHHGESITYGELATRSGASIPARGIGAIMGSNPMPVVVPCHRVLAADGLGGFSGGGRLDNLEVKRWMLTFEGVLPPTLGWDPSRRLDVDDTRQVSH
jgi:methylated-DNA-[protein]-cysteine S-methyltransferase